MKFNNIFCSMLIRLEYVCMYFYLGNSNIYIISSIVLCLCLLICHMLEIKSKFVELNRWVGVFLILKSSKYIISILLINKLKLSLKELLQYKI
jgi:hypothetical protein